MRRSLKDMKIRNDIELEEIVRGVLIHLGD